MGWQKDLEDALTAWEATLKHNIAPLMLCRTCGSKRHHSMLHCERDKPQTEANAPVSCQLSSRTATQVLLGNLKVPIKDKVGRFHTVRGIVDSGSQISATSSCLAQILNLKRAKTDFEI